MESLSSGALRAIYLEESCFSERETYRVLFVDEARWGAFLTTDGERLLPEPFQVLNRVVDDIVSGALGECPPDTLLDEQTQEVLNLLAQQPAPKRPADIAACGVEFARQLDGTHVQEDEERNRAESDEMVTEGRDDNDA